MYLSDENIWKYNWKVRILWLFCCWIFE